MLLGNLRRDMDLNSSTDFNATHFLPSLPTPLTASSTTTRTPSTPQSTMMNYARMPHRYTTATLLSLRPPTEITIFPEHLVERRFLDEENYIDLDRMLAEKAGKFDFDSFNMTDGPIMPSRVHKYDFSDPIVIEKVKNRRPKDPLTPQQVAALTSVATRHQPSTLLLPYQTQSSHVWIDDYSHQEASVKAHRHHLPPQPSMPYQRQNPNQCEMYTQQIKSLLPTYQIISEEKDDQTADTIPILQRLFAAQRVQQHEQGKTDSFQIPDVLSHQSSLGQYQQGLSAFCTPTTPAKPSSKKSFEWFSTPDQSRKDILAQLLKNSTTMETPITPGFDIQKDNDEQNFYSAPPSPTQQQGESLSLFTDKTGFPTSLENWFGRSIYKSAYPRMPSDRVFSACDLEQ
ncbi:unnamed protein product [Adineta ricciae]|uniref:Uncharacterized protein n=1 Tax=Adineta ricciae TaxID=249248 RepID=A0A816CMR9_ADIRI|nr:unnamed protein product [Adineta ricciae]